MKISVFVIFYVTAIPFSSSMEVMRVCRRNDGNYAEPGEKKEGVAESNEQLDTNKDNQTSDEGLLIPAENIVPNLRSQLEQEIGENSNEERGSNTPKNKESKHVVTKSDLAKSLQLLLNMVKTANTDKVSGLKTETDSKEIKKTIKKPRKTTKKPTTTVRTTTKKTTTQAAIHMRAHETNTVDLMDRIMEDFEKSHKEQSNEGSEDDVSHYMRANDDLYYDLTEENSGGLKFKLAV